MSLKMLNMVSYKQLTQIRELTNRFGLNREWGENSPLSAETPALVCKRQNGRSEIIVDAAQPFEEWLDSLEPIITSVMQA